MSRRGHVLSAIVAIAVAGSIVGCTPQSAPSPSPSTSASAFSSDDEAFAAAEATYRAYVDATNARRVDPTSLPDPNDFLSGQALESSLATQEAFEEKGIRLEGRTIIRSVSPINFLTQSATIHVCFDNSGTRLVDNAGMDVTPVDRSVIGGLVVIVETKAPPHIVQSDTQDSGC